MAPSYFVAFGARASAQTIRLQSAGVVSAGSTAITAVALTPNGDLYVAEGTSGVMYYPVNGTAAVVTLPASANIAHLAAGPAGNAFAVDSANSAIYKLNGGMETAFSSGDPEQRFGTRRLRLDAVLRRQRHRPFLDADCLV